MDAIKTLNKRLKLAEAFKNFDMVSDLGLVLTVLTFETSS